MNDEIKEILDNFEKYEARYKLHNETQFIITHREIQILLDYITNLQQKIEQYENPDDMTLFYMWLDAKAKDKIKELQQENERLKEYWKDTIVFSKEYETIVMNTNGYKVYNDYKTRCEKASNNLKRNYLINEHEHNDDVVNMTLNILQNGSDDNE